MEEEKPQIMHADEKPQIMPAAAALKWTVSILAVAMSLYHMYVAGFGRRKP